MKESLKEYVIEQGIFEVEDMVRVGKDIIEQIRNEIGERKALNTDEYVEI